MKYSIDEEHNTVTFYGSKGNEIVKANITNETDLSYEFTIPWSGIFSLEDLRNSDILKMLNKQEGMLWKDDSSSRIDDEEQEHDEDDQAEADDEEDQADEDQRSQERKAPLSKQVGVKLTDSMQRKFDVFRMKKKQTNLLAKLVNNDEDQFRYESAYIESVRDLLDDNISYHDLKKSEAEYDLEDIEIETGPCKEALNGKFSMDSKLGGAAIYSCKDLISTAKRLNSSIESIQDAIRSSGDSSQLKVLESEVTRQLRMSAWKLIDAVDLPDAFRHSEKRVRMKLGLTNYLSFAETLVDLRYTYHTAVLYRLYNKTPLEETVEDIRKEAYNAYNHTGMEWIADTKKPINYSEWRKDWQMEWDLNKML